MRSKIQLLIVACMLPWLLWLSTQAYGGYPPPPWWKYPRLTVINIERTIIWVGDSASRTYGYEKATSIWRVATPPKPLTDPNPYAHISWGGYKEMYQSPVEIMKGVVVFAIPQLPQPSGLFSSYSIRVEGSDQTYPLPQMRQAEVVQWGGLVEYGVDVSKPMSFIQRALADGGAGHTLGPFVVDSEKRRVYFGLQGGFSEGIGGFGGVAIFDLDARRWRIVRHRLLLESAVISMHLDGDDLWMATLHFAEGGVISIAGLVRWDMATDRWSSFTEANSNITGDVVYAIGKDGDRLVLATNRGVSFYYPQTNRWANYFWHDTLVGGSPQMLLRPYRPSIVRETAMDLMRALEVKDPEAFVRVAERTLTPKAVAELPMYRGPGAMLGYDILVRKEFYPFVIAALKGESAETRVLAAEILARMGDKRAIPYLREALSREHFAWVQEALRYALRVLGGG